MHRGYIKIWRKIEDSGLLQMHGTLALFMFMLLKATHKDIRVGMVDLKRGQLSAGRHQLAAAIGLSEQQLRTCEKKLHLLNMIDSKSTNKFTVYTIVNYDNYQDYIDESNKQITNEQQTDNKQLTTKQTHKHISTEYIRANRASVFPEIENRKLVDDWLTIRKLKKLAVTETALDGFSKEVKKAGVTLEQALVKCCHEGWGGFKASWLTKQTNEEPKKAWE